MQYYALQGGSNVYVYKLMSLPREKLFVRAPASVLTSILGVGTYVMVRVVTLTYRTVL